MTVGRTITGVVPVPQTVRFVTPEEFSREIAGAQIEVVSRRAKWMLLALSHDRMLALHLTQFGSLWRCAMRYAKVSSLAAP